MIVGRPTSLNRAKQTFLDDMLRSNHPGTMVKVGNIHIGEVRKILVGKNFPTTRFFYMPFPGKVFQLHTCPKFPTASKLRWCQKLVAKSRRPSRLGCVRSVDSTRVSELYSGFVQLKFCDKLEKIKWSNFYGLSD